ncbi:MAG TPA: hypothetical protein VFW16_03285 [Streptosporangiaceae bacterium]|nr:hypothetical protein [Streptosporangiaceae bacterium]
MLAEVAPAAAAVVTPLALDPGSLAEALAKAPRTFVHGNWKLDNLGTDDAWRSTAAACPQSKEESIDGYRRALEDLGIGTAHW